LQDVVEGWVWGWLPRSYAIGQGSRAHDAAHPPRTPFLSLIHPRDAMTGLNTIAIDNVFVPEENLLPGAKGLKGPSLLVEPRRDSPA